MKSIAIWINNFSTIDNEIDKKMLSLEYKNIYIKHMYSHYFNYFRNYYNKYFYDYFINNEHLSEERSLVQIKSSEIQNKIFELIIRDTEEHIKLITDDSEELQKFYLETKNYQNEMHEKINKKENLEKMIHCSISLFKKYNPTTKTVFIDCNDVLENIEADEIINIPMLNFYKYELTTYYKHASTNSYNYELFCFLRWFIICDYINNLEETYDRIYIFDNDTLVFDNLNNYSFNLNKPIMSICGCPAFTILNKNLLNDLCNKIIDIYKTNNQECFDFSKNNVGVISDMGVFNYLYSKNQISAVNEDFFKPFFIINIGGMLEGEKLPEVKIKNNKLFIKNYIGNCLGIHFAGANKKYMNAMYEIAI